MNMLNNAGAVRSSFQVCSPQGVAYQLASWQMFVKHIGWQLSKVY